MKLYLLKKYIFSEIFPKNMNFEGFLPKKYIIFEY